MNFKSEVSNLLKDYVYVYINPKTDKIFYVGRGKGNRCFDHLNLDNIVDSPFEEQIKELLSKSIQPKIEIIRYGLSKYQAKLIEASIIDLIELDKLENKYRGYHSRTYGRISVEEIIATFEAEEAPEIKENVLCIIINKLYNSNITQDELFESTKGIWKIGKRREKADFVFSVYQGLVKEVYKVNKWHESGTLVYRFRDSSQFAQADRWEFDGELANDELRRKYKNKAVRTYLPNRIRNPIFYINC